jgi:hypothetical protein
MVPGIVALRLGSRTMRDRLSRERRLIARCHSGKRAKSNDRLLPMEPDGHAPGAGRADQGFGGVRLAVRLTTGPRSGDSGSISDNGVGLGT